MNGRARGLAAAVVVSLALGGCAAGSSARATASGRAGVVGFDVVPLGLCEDYPEESRSLEEVRRDIALLAQAEVRVLRVSIGWDGIEPERGHYDLGFWDAFVELMGGAGIRVIPYVAYTPRWAVAHAGADYWRQPPADLGTFAEVMGVLAARYRGRIGSWELWNEPDNRDYWLGTTTEYAALLAAGARAVRAADPAARVVFGGVAGHPEFAAEVLAQPGVAPLVDVINAHAYFETWNAAPTEALPRYVAAFAPALSGGARPLWLAEVGYSTYRRGALVSPDYHARFDYEHTVAFQAVELVRTVTLALTQPEVRLLAWYRVKDPAPRAPMIGDDNNRHLGVAFSDARPKPALAALALMNRLFGAGFVRLDARLRIERPPGSHAEVHAFATPDRAVAIAWIPTDVDGEPAPTAVAGDAQDLRHERLAIELPVFDTTGLHAMDAEGREVGTIATVAPRRSSVVIAPIDLRGGDVAVFELPRAAPAGAPP